MKKIFAVVIAVFAVTFFSYAANVNDLRVAAERGDADAQFALADHYYSGVGVIKDFTEAARWYRKAAEQGEARAQSALAMCYLLGKGVPKDHAEAVKWCRKAAAQGDEGAQNFLREIGETW